MSSVDVYKLMKIKRFPLNKYSNRKKKDLSLWLVISHINIYHIVKVWFGPGVINPPCGI